MEPPAGATALTPACGLPSADGAAKPGDAVRAIADLVHGEAGLIFTADQDYLIRSRVRRRLGELGCCLSTYAHRCRQDAGERSRLIDLLTTNHTGWWRESEHFADLAGHVLGSRRSRRLRVWCAGAASGEEPYSAALCLAKALPDLADWDISILATDISATALARLRAGEYPAENATALPAGDRAIALAPVPGRSGLLRVRPALRALVHAARLNLMAPWPMRGRFDAIFCRNVLIYFDQPTQRRLILRLAEQLTADGTLYIGHGESLAAFPHPLRMHAPSIYRR